MPVEIVELARSLRNDPDLIYQYVHNNIHTMWMYGLQKGALGTEIDKAGTAFDQAELMIALLRQAGYSASYIASTIILDQAQFSDWTGITSARAACYLLSGGGIPAKINGTTDVACSNAGFDGNVTTVQMAHIWVGVTINGTDYVFDPSYKKFTWKTGIDLASAMVFGDPLGDATTGGGYISGTISGVPFARSLNTAALNGDLQSYASKLLAYIQTNNLQGAQLEDIIGGGVIVPDYNVLRQTSLPYADQSPPYQHIWTPGSRYNAIPDQYRTTLTIDAQAQQWEDQNGQLVKIYARMFKDENGAPPKLYTDEVYGRRLTIETNFTPQGIHEEIDYFPQRACLALDAEAWTTWSATTRPSFCLGAEPNQFHYDYEVTCCGFFHVAPARDLRTHILLTADHPYAASNGAYMDTTIDKNVMLITPLTIVHGWGDVSAALFNKWSEERAFDDTAAIMLHAPYCPGESGSEGATCPQSYLPSAGNFTREKLAANWLSQMTRAFELNAAIANSVPQIHHVLGFVYGDATMQGASIRSPFDPPDFTLGDNYDRIDVDAGVSLANKTADLTKRNAAFLAFAASSATLEGAMAGQMSDVPDTASTATRFEWGNSPDPDHTEFSQNPFNIGPQNFLQYDDNNKSQADALTKVDGGVPESCSWPPGKPFGWGQAPQLTAGACSLIAGDVASQIKAYAQNGFKVVASQEAFLGPGQRGGTIFPIVDNHGVTTGYDASTSKQRGGAFVAVKFDANGNPTEVAHIITGPSSPDHVGIVGTKGGGAGAEPDNKTTYDPATAADILKSRFVDRSTLFGVNLSNGSLAYTSPISLRVGNGGFPYELTASLSWHPAPPPPLRFAPVSPIAPPSGWVDSWHNSLTLSGSGLEAMGQSDIRAAAGAIVAFYTTQSIYKAPPSPQRDAAAVLTHAWWAHQLSGNVATVNIGGNARQFVKLATGAWILPGGGFATFVQNGDRTPYEEKCFYRYRDNPPYALTRGWDSHLVSFTVTNANGDVQSFGYFKNSYHTDDIRICGNLKGFRLTNWTFPYGMAVTPTYMPVTTGLDQFDALVEVHNSTNRKLTFSGGTIGNGLNGDDARTISYTQPLQGQSTITDQLGHDMTFTYLGPFYNPTPTQRPVPYRLLYQYFTPDSSEYARAEYGYDGLGRVEQVKDATAIRYGTRGPYLFYLADGTRGERVDPLLQSYVVDYDTYGHPARYIDELAHETDALFDSRGRVVRYVYPEGDCELFGYDNRNNTTSYKRIDKTSSCDPNAGAEHILTASAEYHANWNKPISVTNFRNKETVLEYFESGAGASLLKKVTRPTIDEGVPIYQFTYTSIGKLETATGPSGIVTQNGYDAGGNLISTIVDPGTVGHLHLTTTFGYDAQGDVNLTIDPRQFATTSTYELDRLKSEDHHHNGDQNATLNAASRIRYDLRRRKIAEDAGWTFSGTGVTSWKTMKQFDYTATSMLHVVTDADGRQTYTWYDDDDRVQRVVDPLSRTTKFLYCELGDSDCAANAVKTELRAYGGSTNNCVDSGHPLQQCYRRVTYFADGEEKTVTDANGNVTNYDYDAFIRLNKTTFPDGTFEKLTLDENGNVTERKNRAGETLTYQYNALDWITQKCMPAPGASCPANPAVTDYWSYLLDGRIASICETLACGGSVNKIIYDYDTAGRLTEVQTRFPGWGDERKMTYTLDANGNRTKLQWDTNYDGGYWVGYCYDNLNRMTVALEKSTACTDTQNTLATYTYDPVSRRTALAYRGTSGASITYDYSDAGDLLSLNHDMSGNGDDPHYSFTYTDAHQLKKETNSDPDYVWQPSANGTDTYTAANNLNQYPSFQPQGSLPRPLGYDAKGNLITGKLTGSGAVSATWTLAYDAENRLLTANKSDATVAAAYEYDPLGRRIHKSGTGVTNTWFLNDGDDEVVEYNSNKDVVALYVPGPAIDEPIAMVTPNGNGTYSRKYFHTNHQGSVIAMSDDAGARVEGPFIYGPYGNCFQGTTPCAQLASSVPYKFTSRRLDPETELYYYRARMYWGTGGRFLQTDPVGYTADLNLYTYVGNDPTDEDDPTGLANTACGSGNTGSLIPGQNSGFCEGGAAFMGSLRAGTRKSQPRQNGPSQPVDQTPATATAGSNETGCNGCAQATADSNDSDDIQLAQFIEPFINTLGARPPFRIVPKVAEQLKERVPGLSGKEAAKNAPSWARGLRPRVGESGKDAAERFLNTKYGKGNWDRGPKSEYNQLRKYFDRGFRDPLPADLIWVSPDGA